MKYLTVPNVSVTWLLLSIGVGVFLGNYIPQQKTSACPLIAGNSDLLNIINNKFEYIGKQVTELQKANQLTVTTAQNQVQDTIQTQEKIFAKLQVVETNLSKLESKLVSIPINSSISSLPNSVKIPDISQDIHLGDLQTALHENRYSPDPKKRIRAYQLMAEVGTSEFKHNIAQMLSDPNESDEVKTDVMLYMNWQANGPELAKLSSDFSQSERVRATTFLAAEKSHLNNEEIALLNTAALKDFATEQSDFVQIARLNYLANNDKSGIIQLINETDLQKMTPSVRSHLFDYIIPSLSSSPNNQ